jgi:hypothetical protein
MRVVGSAKSGWRESVRAMRGKRRFIELRILDCGMRILEGAGALEMGEVKALL